MIKDSNITPFKVLSRSVSAVAITSFNHSFLEQKYSSAGSKDFTVGGIHLTES